MAFRELQAVWYAKLKATGFEDIERPGEYADDILKGHWLKAAARAAAGARSGGAEFWRLAYEWVDVAVWHSRVQRLIWALYAAGWTEQRIRERHSLTTYEVLHTIRKNKEALRAYYQAALRAEDDNAEA